MNNKKTNKNHTSHLAPHTSNYNNCRKIVGTLSVSNTQEDSQTVPIDHRGITLIALIITIIVMLILVAVTITVALNSGLFGTARKAAYQTEISEIQEQLEIAKAVKVAENGGEETSDYGITINDLPISDELKTKYGSKLVVSKNGTLYYDPAVVTEEEERGWIEEIGISAYTGEEDTDLTALKKYFLGEDGRDINDIFNSDTTFKPITGVIENPNDVLKFLNQSVAGSDGSSLIMDMYVCYKEEAVYKVRCDMDSNTGSSLTRELEFLYKNENDDSNIYQEGDIYKFDADGNGEKDWIILYNYGDTMEIVSPEPMGELTLGYEENIWEDEQVKSEAEIDGIEGLTDTEKNIYSYNNAIDKMNKYCDSLITNKDKISVRSAGTNPYNNIDTSEFYSSDVLGIYNQKIKNSDNNYEQDFARLSYFNIAKTSSYYWLGTRSMINYMQETIRASVGTVDSNGTLNMNLMEGDNLLDFVYRNNELLDDGQSISYPVRPIVKIAVPET